MMRALWRAVRAVDRALALPIVGLLMVYRFFASPLYGETCRFYPSCSAYSLGAFRRLGLVRGLGLSTWRLLRCNPWNAGGVDLVPGTRAPSIAAVSAPDAERATEDLIHDVTGESQGCHHHGEPAIRRAA